MLFNNSKFGQIKDCLTDSLFVENNELEAFNPPPQGFLLLEDDGFLLLEDDGLIALE